MKTTSESLADPALGRQGAILTVSRNRNREWGNYFIDCFVNSGRFQVDYEDFPSIRNLGRRGASLKPLRHNGRLILIDDWDYANPTSGLNAAFYESNSYYRDTRMVLKVQYSTKDKHLYPNLPVIPFLIFPRSTFQLSAFKWDGPGTHLTSFSGKGWRNRRGWLRKLKTMQNVCVKIENPDPKIQDEYYDVLSHSTWGLILKGKGPGGKNRREVEYMSCGMPLALNYIPEYPFDFIPDVDYLYLQSPKDLEKLYSTDPWAFAARSIKNYDEHFSPDGIVATFERIVMANLGSVS